VIIFVTHYFNFLKLKDVLFFYGCFFLFFFIFFLKVLTAYYNFVTSLSDDYIKD